MLQLRLTFDDPTGGQPTPPPAGCPRPGCGGGRVRRWQKVAKPVRGRAGGAVTAERHMCLDCRRTFRVYPHGIDRGTVPAAVRHWAAALHALGLPYRDVSRALAVLGVALGKSRLQTLARPLAGVGKPRPGWLGAVLERVEIEGEGAGELGGAGEGAGGFARDDTRAGVRAAARDADGRAERTAWVWIDGQRHALRPAVDARGRVALVVDGVGRDLCYIVDAWAGAMLAAHGVHAAVVYGGDAGRCRDSAGAALGMAVGGIGQYGAMGSADDCGLADGCGPPGLDPTDEERAAVTTAPDLTGCRSNPPNVSWGDIPGVPIVSGPASVAPPWGPAPRHRGSGGGAGRRRAGIGVPPGAFEPRAGRARHRPGRPKGRVPQGSRGPCHAFDTDVAARPAA